MMYIRQVRCNGVGQSHSYTHRHNMARRKQDIVNVLLVMMVIKLCMSETSLSVLTVGMVGFWFAQNASWLDVKVWCKKILEKVSGHSCQSQIQDQNQRNYAFKRSIFDSFKMLYTKNNSLKSLVDTLQLKINAMEDRVNNGYVPMNQNRVNDNDFIPMDMSHPRQNTTNYEHVSQPSTSFNNCPDRNSCKTPPAYNLRSRSADLPQSKKVTLNLRYGQGGEIQSQSFYHRCELCLVERFLPVKNDTLLCPKCVPLSSIGKSNFYRVLDQQKKRFWMCSCQKCKAGLYKVCVQKPCNECTNYRDLISGE